MNWYILKNGISEEMSDEKLIEEIKNGQLEPQTQVTNDGLDKWIPLCDCEIWEQTPKNQFITQNSENSRYEFDSKNSEEINSQNSEDINSQDFFCPRCGAKLAKEQRFCPTCGQKTNVLPKENIFVANKKKLISVGIIVCVALVIICFVNFNKRLFLSKEEKYALQAVELVQDDLLAPETMRLIDVAISDEIEKPEDDDDGKWTIRTVYIYYSATNKGGGITDKDCVVKFFNKGSTEVVYSHTDYEVDSEDDLEKQISYNLDNIAVASAALENTIFIDTEKLEKLIHD